MKWNVKNIVNNKCLSIHNHIYTHHPLEAKLIAFQYMPCFLLNEHFNIGNIPVESHVTCLSRSQAKHNKPFVNEIITTVNNMNIYNIHFYGCT